MYKYIVKLVFVTVTTFGVVAPVFALEVKLLCSIKLISTHSNGHVRIENFTDVIDVYDDNYLVLITPQADKLSGVSASKSHRTPNVNNFSDNNKWDIEVTHQARAGQIVRTSINIDRNTGMLFYLSNWDRGKLVDSATGSCEKVDATKRKF